MATSSESQLVPVPPSGQRQAPPELTEDDIGEQVHSRGRPRKGEAPGSRFNLAKFLAVKRKNLYLETDQSHVKGVAKYMCVPCQREIRFVSMTDQAKLLNHEKAERHKRGLERLKRSSEPEVPVSDLLALQNGDRASCPGIASSDPSMPPHQLERSIKQYCWAGQPRTVYKDNEKDPMAGAVLEQHLSSVVIRSTKCDRVRDSHTSACAACMKQARDKGMLGAVATKAYDIDLVTLAFKSAHGTKDEVEQFKKDIQERDYFVLGWAGNSFKELIQGRSGLQLVQRIRSRFDTTPAWRKSESFKGFLQHYLTTTSMYHDGDTQMEAHNALTSALAGAVQEGRVQAMDVDLAARIAADLRSDAVIEGLVTTFLLRSQEALQGPNSSRHLKDLGAMSEALSTLGKRSEIDALLKRFGVNPRSVPKMSLDSGLLPKAFGAMGNLAQLKSSIQKAACHLRSMTKRLHVMMDETVWSASAEQCKGFLQDEGNCDVILGGYWSPQAEDQWHYLDANQWAEAGVPPEKLAKLSLHFVVTRPDNPRFCLDTCMLPRAPRQRTSADEMLELCGSYLESATSVAGGPAMYNP